MCWPCPRAYMGARAALAVAAAGGVLYYLYRTRSTSTNALPAMLARSASTALAFISCTLGHT